jgi:hypothetical protein
VAHGSDHPYASYTNTQSEFTEGGMGLLIGIASTILILVIVVPILFATNIIGGYFNTVRLVRSKDPADQARVYLLSMSYRGSYEPTDIPEEHIRHAISKMSNKELQRFDAVTYF